MVRLKEDEDRETPGLRWRQCLTRDELLYLWSIRAFVTVMNYRVGYSGEVTHVTSSPTTFGPTTHTKTSFKLLV